MRSQSTVFQYIAFVPGEPSITTFETKEDENKIAYADSLIKPLEYTLSPNDSALLVPQHSSLSSKLMKEINISSS